MRAIRYHEYGDSSVLHLEDAPDARPGAGEVVVQVAGTSVNMLDVAIRLGILQNDAPIAFPHIPGVDVAGRISEVGPGVTDWHTGDAVIAFLPATAAGAAAEYVSAPAALLAPAPASVDLADAAALPLAGLTAWQALVENARLRAGQSILVNGAGGGVGGFAVQLARREAATVTATASDRSRERVRAAGADRIVDYAATPVAEQLAGERFDVVLNLVRNSPVEAAALADLVVDRGVFVSATTPGPERPERNIRVEQVAVRSDPVQLTRLVALVDGGELVLDIAQRLPLADLHVAHDQALHGMLPGKTVLIV
ncbi:NADP-dependent oxidoreductase [Gordonia sp. ABSL11-1]|uniref:NADP-dependent oxidoreductase n=1 Tax=Gordonia sp. ABSL11-1 TaxID=3053924 RepID=UPI0025734A92|nr:NADP-dependent oxidoreductase [Gordonia sp. ABSL11-1]MDL9947665.1 NADP-dependent oxidoreductase [Gordonia sp. ABSL11-1]